MVLDNFFNAIFGPLIQWNSNLALIFISFLLTFLITLVYKRFTDQDMLRSVKTKLKGLQKEMKDLKNQPEKLMKKQKEMMEMNLKMLSHTIKPSLYTILPLFVMYSWLRNTFAPMGDILLGLSWIWIYILSSVFFSFLLRRLLGVH